MDNRLVLTILFVTLAWGFMGTHAQNSTTAASTNSTAAPSTNTTAVESANTTDVGSTNSTAAPSTNSTAAPSTNSTAAPSTNSTAAPSTNITAVGSTNAMTAASTNTTGATTTNLTTSAPLLTPNFTVTFLQTPISRQQCGIQQLCAAEPSNCDPSSVLSCFFLGARQISGQNFAFALSGQTEGFIAAILSPDATLGGNDTAYICANNNGTVMFFEALLDNNQLTVTELNVNNVKGSVNGSEIQCTFDATVPDATRTRANTTRFSMSVFTGSFDASTNALGTPQPRIKTNVVDLSNVNATIINELTSNTTTASPTTTTIATASGHAIQQSLMQALLITVGVLSLTRL